MTIYTRRTKSSGSTSWQAGEIILHSEHNDEWDSFLLDYNGNIIDANVKSDADISVLKISDHAANDTAFLNTGTDPGDHFSTTKPTDLPTELETLRHRIKWNEGGTNLKARNAAGAMVTVGWTEPPIIGRNLLPNPGFEQQTGGAGTAPDGWDISGTPTTLAIQAATGSEDDAGIDKRSFNIIGTVDGISTNVVGLKSNTKYRIGVCWLRTAGTIQLSTLGGLGTSANYGDLQIDDSSSGSLSYENGIIKTNSSGGPIVVLIRSISTSAELNVFYAWMYEMADDAPIEMPSVPIQIAKDSTERVIGPGSPAVFTQMSLSQYVPSPGYFLEYEADISIAIDTLLIVFTPAIEMQIDSGGWVIVFQKTEGSAVTGGLPTTQSLQFKHTVPSPISGANYQFRIAWTLGSGTVVNELFGSIQPDSHSSLFMGKY